MELERIQSKIITIQGEQVILDSDVAELYGVETKRINGAVRNNPEKFPTGYILQPTSAEWNKMKYNLSPSLYIGDEEITDLRTKNSSAKFSKARVIPNAFSERGLYMLATILKSPVATETSIAIIETFAKVKELSRTFVELSGIPEDKVKQKSLMQRSGELIADILDDDLKTINTETCVEVNLALFKVKHTVKRASEAPKSRK